MQSAQGWSIVDIAQQLYPTARAEIKDDVYTLTLDESKEVKFPKSIDEVVRNHPTNSPLQAKLKGIFRRYQEKIIYLKELESKIIRAVEKSDINSSGPKEGKVSTAGNIQTVLTKQQAELFQAGVSVIEGIEKQDVLLFIGDTGCGKTTTMNYLLGCKMKYVARREIGLPSGNPPKVLVAENPKGKIGHKRESKTSYPQIIIDDENQWAYCDCPGMKDTRGAVTEIYNALCIKRVIEEAKAVKGFLVFVDYPSLIAREGIKDKLKYLQLLLKDFSKHKNAVLFVITKVLLPEEQIDLNNIREDLLNQVGELINDSDDEELRKFCQQIIDSRILENGIGERVIICNPGTRMAEQDRANMLRIINQFSAFTLKAEKRKAAFGYPISSKAEADIEKTRTFIVLNTQKLLQDLKQAIALYWEDETKKPGIRHARACLEEIDRWLASLPTKPSCEHFADSPAYQAVSDKIANDLQQSIILWDKLKEIFPPSSSSTSGQALEADIYNLNDRSKASLDILANEIKAIRDKIKKLYFLRMHIEIKSTLIAALESYPVQSSLKAVRKDFDLDLGKISEFKAKDFSSSLLTISQKLSQLTNTAFPSSIKKIEEILEDDEQQAKLQELKQVLTSHLFQPFAVDKGKDRIEVKANINCIALSAIIEEIKDSFKGSTSPQEILLKAKGQGGEEQTLYFDEDLTQEQIEGIKGRAIIVNADRIQVIKANQRKDYKIDLRLSWLRSASISFIGKLIGSEKIENKLLILSAPEAAIDANQIKTRMFGYEWRS